MTFDMTRLPGSPPFDPSAVPAEIVLTRGGRSLRLSWHDRAGAVLSAETLRLGCRCAWCTRDRLEDRFPAAFDGIRVTGLEPKGGYAVHIVFSDGHARGIFPWVLLRDLAAPAPAAPQAA